MSPANNTLLKKKISIVLDELRGEETNVELCRRERILRVAEGAGDKIRCDRAGAELTLRRCIREHQKQRSL